MRGEIDCQIDYQGLPLHYRFPNQYPRLKVQSTDRPLLPTDLAPESDEERLLWNLPKPKVVRNQDRLDWTRTYGCVLVHSGLYDMFYYDG